MTVLKPAPEGYPIKLVRDHTARIVNPSGEPGDLWYEEAPPEELSRALRLKLAEEVAEFLVDGGLDELADVLAVVEGIARTEFRVQLEQLHDHARADRRGGFLTGQMMYGRHPEFDGA